MLLLSLLAGAALAAEPVPMLPGKGPVDYRYAKAKAYAWTAAVFAAYPNPDKSMDRFLRQNIDVTLNLSEQLEAEQRRRYRAVADILVHSRQAGNAEELVAQGDRIWELRSSYIWGNMFPKVMRAAFDSPDIEAALPPWPKVLVKESVAEEATRSARELGDKVCEHFPEWKLDGKPYCDNGGTQPAEPPLELPQIIRSVPPPLKSNLERP